jgi:hypothetical protein
MLRFDEGQLDLVRDEARPYRPKIEAPPADATLTGASFGRR